LSRARIQFASLTNLELALARHPKSPALSGHLENSEMPEQRKNSLTIN